MTAQSLVDTAEALVAPGKGILAADESTGTIGKRFAALGIENTEKNRRDYREMLFSAPGASEHISGAILYNETLRQKASGGGTIVDLLASRSIIPGIKVDTGVHPLAGAPGEVVTEGLDALRDRLAEYFEIGARFAKWRAVLTIGPDIPSRYCIEVNAHAMARYAALCQEAGLAPIVEPEVLMDGDHAIDRCREATEATLGEVYDQLGRQRVALEGTLLKPNMVISGKDAADRAGSDEVAEKTLDCLIRTVPESVPGIVFLSGGQGDAEATENLNALSIQGREAGAPWEISFSYGRALQSAPLGVWAECRDRESSQKAFMRRAVLTAAARRGEYRPRMGE